MLDRTITCERCGFIGSERNFWYYKCDSQRGECNNCRAQKREKAKAIYRNFLEKTQNSKN